MEKLFEKSFQKIDRVPLGFKRYLLTELDHRNRMTGIKGARGTGKTTLLLQYIRLHLPLDHRTLYVSLDDLYFQDHYLVDLAEQFKKQGGCYLVVDEVHRYPGWSVELKNIYDDFPELHVLFTGSSVIHLSQAAGDLSRRAVMYELPGLSYREYLNVKSNLNLPAVNWEELPEWHTAFARDITQEIRPLAGFRQYLQNGYYPYVFENEEVYTQKLTEVIDISMNIDLPAAFKVTFSSLEKLKKLLSVIAENVPFQPNISKLSERIGVTRNTLVQLLGYLEELRIIKRIYARSRSISSLQKPDKIMMHHPNLHYALAYHLPETGSLRESFFVNQVGVHHPVQYAAQGDYHIEDRLFEIGGRSKTKKQIKDLENAFVVADDLEIGTKQTIPLWLFGFLY